MTRAELAALLKTKYPAYASIPDEELVTKIVAKYPTYQAQITESAAPATPPPPTPTNRGTGTGVTPTSDTGVVGGFLETSPLNPKNLFEMAKGFYEPTAAAGTQVLRDATSGNVVKAGIGALDLFNQGPAKRVITDPVYEHAGRTGEALVQGDYLKAAEQASGMIPGNAGVLALGQKNAGNPAALAGNLAGIFTAPRAARKVGQAAEAGVGVAGKAAGAVMESAPAHAVASGARKAVDLTRASIAPEALNSAGATAIVTGAITMNPYVGLSAGAAELLRKVVPQVVERWRNGGATLEEIKTAAKAADKAAADNVKYRGVSKEAFGEIQDHLGALKYEAQQAAKAEKGATGESVKSAKAETRIIEMDQAARAKSAKSAPETPAAQIDPIASLNAGKPVQKAAQATEVPPSAAPVSVAPVAKTPLEKATSLAYTLADKGYDAPAIKAQLLKSHPTLSAEFADKLVTNLPKSLIPASETANALATKGYTITEIAEKLTNESGQTTNAALRAARDAVVARGETMTAAQRLEAVQLPRGRNLKKVRLEDITPGRKPPIKPDEPSPKPRS